MAVYPDATGSLHEPPQPASAAQAALRPAGRVAGVGTVAVVGGGLSGMACAAALAACGVRVHLFDAQASPQAVPAPVEIVPNLLRELAALGVADDCVKAGFAFQGLDVFDRQGRLQSQLSMQHLAGARLPAALGLTHDALMGILQRRALDLGVRLHRAAPVQSLSGLPGQPVLERHGAPPLRCDLVVLATGSGSALRQASFPQAWSPWPAGQGGATGQVWWSTLLPRPLSLQRAALHLASAGRKALLVPVRGDLAGLTLTEPVLPAPATAGAWLATHLRQALQAFAAPLRELARHVPDGSPVGRRVVRHELLPPPWHAGAVVAVGNAAHALPPHFGQAAAQALEDALVLADLLRQAPASGAELAQRFTERRYARVQQVHQITVTAARWDLAPDSATDLGELSQRLTRLVTLPA